MKIYNIYILLDAIVQKKIHLQSLKPNLLIRERENI